MITRVIDAGGTSVKLQATGQGTFTAIPSGPVLTPKKMVAAVRAATAGRKYDADPPADLTVERISDLLNCDLSTLLGAAKAGHTK